MENFMSIFENADPFKTWWPTIAAILVGVVIMVRTIMSGQRCPNDNQIREQIVIITGGNSGIGFELAKALATRGARIILACRDMEAAERAAAIIKRELKSHSIDITTTSDNGDSIETEKYFIEARCIDLRSFDSVRRFARNIMAEFERIDVLVNNAGMIFHTPSRSTRNSTATINTATTADGFEVHLQVNYLSHFLLTQLLLPHLRRAQNGRVVNVSAHAAVAAASKIDFDDPLNVGTWSVKFHARDAFAHSKLAVLLATRWLARELKDSSVTVNCCTPGLVRGTGHLRNSPLMSAICVKLMTYPWMWLFMKNPCDGAQCAIRLATDPQLKHVTGEYFNDCEIVSSNVGKDMELAKRIYMQTMHVLEKSKKLHIDIKEPVEPEQLQLEQKK